jgi:hypothetical protein
MDSTMALETTLGLSKFVEIYTHLALGMDHFLPLLSDYPERYPEVSDKPPDV